MSGLSGAELETGVLCVAVFGAEELGAGLEAGLLCSRLLCLAPSGAECVVFADAIFSELALEVVEDFLSRLDIFLLWIRGAASAVSSSEHRKIQGLNVLC